MSFHFLDWTILVFYLFSLIAIGAYHSRRQKTIEEYFLGGRRFGAIIMSISVLGTATSAISFLGVPGFVVSNDWSILVSSLAGIPAALIVAYFFVPIFYQMGLTSVYGYLALRFDRRLERLNSVLFLLMRGALAGMAIFAPSVALSVVTGWDLALCIIISAALTTLYTTIGGMSAVVWTEVLQVVTLFGGAIFLTVYLAMQLDGGVADWMAILNRENKFNLFDFSISITRITFWSSSIGGLFFGVAFYGVDQVLVQRYLSANSVSAARRSLSLNALFSIPSLLLLFVLGSVLYLFIRGHRSEFPTTLTGDQHLPFYIVRFLPVGLPGLMVAAIYAAAMSTLSSVLNSLTTITITDFVKPRLKNPRSEIEYLRLVRWISCGWGTLSILTALGAKYLDERVTIAAVKVASLFMGAMLGVFLLGLASSRVSASSALRACLVGILLSFVAGFATALDTLWLAAFGTLATFGWGVLEAVVSPASPAIRAAKEHYTWRGYYTSCRVARAEAKS